MDNRTELTTNKGVAQSNSTFWCCIAYHDSVSDLAFGDGVLDTTKVLVEPALQTNHELHSGLVTGVDGLNRLGQVRGDGLLAKDVFAVGGTGLDLLGMELRRGADPDSIDLRVGDDLHGIRSELGEVVRLGGYKASPTHGGINKWSNQSISE